MLEQGGGGVETRTQDCLSSDHPALAPHPQPAGKGVGGAAAPTAF